MASPRVSKAYSSNADGKIIREMYPWPFADGVKGGMGAVILSHLLKTELGFPGVVVPDVNSQKTAFGSANAGLDYGSSSLWSEKTIMAGLRNGSLTQARLDDMAVRNTISYFYVGLDYGKQPPVADVTEYRDVRGNHSAMIRQIASESLVRLKNNNDGGRGLPLNQPHSMAVFGAHAHASIAGPSHASSILGSGADTFDGHLVTPSGSGSSSFANVVDPHMALMSRQMKHGGIFWGIMNDTYSSGNTSASASIGSGLGTTLKHSYTVYAQNAAACLVFLNTYSGEGADRGEPFSTDQDSMVNRVASECNKCAAF